VLEAAEAARAAPPGPDPPRVVDVLLDAFAIRLTEGYAGFIKLDISSRSRLDRVLPSDATAVPPR
jgi:hypothetical protein